jgi:methyl-accepting chemotaxis protein
VNSRYQVLFCLLALVAVGMNVKFILDMNNEASRNIILEDIRKISGASATGEQPSILRTVSIFRTRLLILLAVNAVCFGLLLYLFFKRFVVPLESILRGAQEIAEGNLAITWPSCSADQIRKLSDAVSNIAANYQEILLLTGTKIGHCRSAVEKIKELLEDEPEAVSGPQLRQQMQIIENELNMLTEMVKSFEFYQTYFDGSKVVRRNPESKRIE